MSLQETRSLSRLFRLYAASPLASIGSGPHRPYIECVIGSIRREGTGHIVALGEGHLRSVLREYVEYYNAARCHQSLGGNAPELRHVDGGPGAVVARPYLGGLHHRYTRAA